MVIFRKAAKKIDVITPVGIGKDMRRDTGLYTKEVFQYDETKDCYICPAGEVLEVFNRSHRRTKYSEKWINSYSPPESKCQGCEQKTKCTVSTRRKISRGEFEAEQVRMRQKLKTEAGRALYKKRKAIVEPVIGQIKTVGGFIQFLLRGLLGAKIEWKWATIAHNLLKITRKVLSGERKLIPLPV